MLARQIESDKIRSFVVKSYNGVAIVSRLPIKYYEHLVCVGGKDDCRHICARINGFKIHNFYVPAGGDVADRDVNPKFGHKIDFVDEMKEWFSNKLSAKICTCWGSQYCTTCRGCVVIAPIAKCCQPY